VSTLWMIRKPDLLQGEDLDDSTKNNALERLYFRPRSPHVRASFLSAMLVEDAPDVAASMLALSKTLGKLHRKKEAEQYRAQALSIVASRKNPAYSGDTIDIRAFRPR